MACSGVFWVFNDIDESHILSKICWMTFLPVIRTIRGIEIGLAGYRKSKAHLTVSRIACLHGIAGKTHQALSDALSPTICPRCTTSFFFFFVVVQWCSQQVQESCQLCQGMAERCRAWRTDHRHRRHSCFCWHVVRDELDLSPVLVHTQLEQSVSRLAVPGAEVCPVLC